MSIWRSVAIAGMVAGLTVGVAQAELLLVASRNNDRVLKYDLATGDYLGEFGSDTSLPDPTGIAMGPDGKIYVGYWNSSNNATGAIKRFDLAGNYIDTFSEAARNPTDLEFGPDGHLYVSRINSDGGGLVRLFGPGHAQAGQLDASFAGGAGKLGDNNVRGIETIDNGDGTFDILWTDVGTYQVVRSALDGTTVATYDGLPTSARPQALDLGPDGKLYATHDVPNAVYCLDLPNLAASFTQFDDGSASPALNPIGLEFDGGRVLVASFGTDLVAEFDSSGSFVRNLVTAGSGGLDGAGYGILTFVIPEPSSLVMLAIAAVILAGYGWRRRKRRT